jgi:FMN phosphatase YigB (HAD superfamily)
MDWIKDIKVMIFDMDGTLYQEDTYLRRFLTYILEDQYSDEQIKKVIGEAYDILKGEHFVSLGHYYDFTTNSIFTHNELIPNSAYSWEGQKLEHEHSSDSRLFYIGDPWEIAFLLGKRLGISEEVKNKAFSRVRAEMLTADYAIPKSEKLMEALKNIDMDIKILITNSPFESGEVFLEFLEVLPYFDETIYDGKKPGGTEQTIKRLMKKGYKPEEILSIGDNPKNDLHPARKIGARTVFISDYRNIDQTPWDYKVKNIDELVSFLQQFRTKAISKS